MPEVFALHGSLDFDWHVIVHLEKHVSLVLVLVGVAVLVGTDTASERDNFASVPSSTACKVRVDDNGGEGDRTESIGPCLVPVHLILEHVRLKVVVEAVICALPLDVLSEVLTQEEVIDMVLHERTGRKCFSEDARTDTSQEKSISSSSRHFDFFYFFIIMLISV